MKIVILVFFLISVACASNHNYILPKHAVDLTPICSNADMLAVASGFGCFCAAQLPDLTTFQYKFACPESKDEEKKINLLWQLGLECSQRGNKPKITNGEFTCFVEGEKNYETD